MSAKDKKSSNARGRSSEKAKLPQLYFLGIFLGVISFAMGFGGLIFLLFDLYPTIKILIYQKEMFRYLMFNERNIHTFVLCFCGFMSEKPTSWLVRLADNPQEFFLNECKFTVKYRPVIWGCIWSTLFFWFVFSMDRLESQYRLFPSQNPNISSNLLILSFSYLISILIIALIEYYRRRMMVR